jgi:hypothetical protein
LKLQGMQLQTHYFRTTDQERRIRFRCCLLLITCCVFIFLSCDHTFRPFQENDKYHFSIYGYLDASADTQWVRVGPARQDINEPPDPTGIKVTLENLQSGESVLMNDSLSSSKSFLNYWTTMEIENEQTYRLIVEESGGKTSRVIVTTPSVLPTIYIISGRVATPSGSSASTNIYIDDSVERIADLQSVWYVNIKPATENRRRIYRFPLRNTLKHTDAYFGAYYAFNVYERELAYIEQSAGGAEIEIVYRQIFVAAGGPEWDNNIPSIDDLEYFLDGTASNVENGLGYVVGISSGWYRQATCLTPDRSNFAPCHEEKPFW